MKKDLVSKLASEFILNVDSFLHTETEEISLPDIAITGTKKCGTYALLEFLIAHPRIQGPVYKTKEYTFLDTGRFEIDFAAFVRPMKFKGPATKNKYRLMKIVGFNTLKEKYYLYKANLSKG